MFYIFLNRQRRPVLGDSGCSNSFMSYEYYVKNPYLKRFFTPKESCGSAINGSDVPSIGEVVLKFTLSDTPMSITCRVIKGLMDPVVLGWDWMYKYGVMLDATGGYAYFCNGKYAELIENQTPPPLGPVYRVFEDLTLPPSSKVLTNVELVLDNYSLNKAPSTIVTDPFTNNGAQFWAARGCSVLKGDRFVTEFLNPTNKPLKITAGTIIGHAHFLNQDEFKASYFETEMTCPYEDEATNPLPTQSTTASTFD